MRCDHCGDIYNVDWTLMRYREHRGLSIKQLCNHCRATAQWQGSEIIKVSRDRSDLDLEILKRSL